MSNPSHPEVIQGGMGVGVSGWRLARAVAAAGGLGVVSGTALDVQLARRLPASTSRVGRLPRRRATRSLRRSIAPACGSSRARSSITASAGSTA